MLAAVALSCVPPHPPAGQARTQPDEIEPAPVGIVVLVDESGSLGDADVQAERAATALIAQGEFAKRSQIAVIGFGGRNGQENTLPVARTVCPTTRVEDAQDRDLFTRCVATVHRRTKQEGDATDFPSALSQGLATLGKMDEKSPKIAVIMTDGKINVDDDPAYGGAKEDREPAGREAMKGYLRQADDAGVQVWPLGFGAADENELRSFAEGGSQRTCGPHAPKPTQRMAADPAAVVTSLAEAYASARCAQVVPSEKKELPAGGTVELGVDVPAIATDGSIAVHKTNPAIRVSYVDPHGREVPKSGSLGDSEFQVSGESGPVEVLRMRDPEPGRWTVRLTAPPDVAVAEVAAYVIWQGAVSSSITVSPPEPQAGEQVTVEMILRTRRGVVTDPNALREITAAATMKGDGFTPFDFPLAVGDGGRFTGRGTVPDTATGAFEVVGRVGGSGIADDERPRRGTVSPESAGLRGTVDLRYGLIRPGDSVTGTIRLTNDTGTGHKLRIRLTETDSRRGLTITPRTHEVDGSPRAEIPIELTADEHAQLGYGQARLQVVDDTGKQLYAEELLTFEIGYPPPPPSPWPTIWRVAAVVALAAFAVGAWLYLRRLRERDVRGLQAELYRNGRQLAYLAAPDQRSLRFSFAVRDEDGADPRLDHATDDAEAYVVTRGAAGVVMVRTPEGTELDLPVGERTGLAGRLELAVADTRIRRASRDTDDIDDGLVSVPPHGATQADDDLT